MIAAQAGISILDKKDYVLDAYDNLKTYHESSDVASVRSVILLDELDLLRPKDSTSLGDFLSTFSTKVTEYDNIAPAILSSEMKKLKLQRCVTGDDCPINSISILHIATRAAGNAVPTCNQCMEAMTKACGTYNAANMSKRHVKSTPTQQVLIGEVNHYNDDYEDKFFDATDYTALDIQNAPTDTLSSFTTNLLVAYESVSKRQ